MNKEFFKTIGTSFDLCQTEKAYTLGGMNISWIDYTFDWYRNLSEHQQMALENLDNAWDIDRYYNDFDAWWVKLSTEKQAEIYHQIVLKNN